MTASTTLMTFRVRTPPNTRSVELYGSWDNFSMPYRMQNDLRLGNEHWMGCHSFENIICDGRIEGHLSSRDGALKMGGTYWYYYKLNHDIEFHNSTEPSTTACRLLPGQLVNVLQVPVALSGSRVRDASTSSTSSEMRTLNPQDRFMNPRPVPTPKLFRMTTSPSVPQLPHSSTSSPTTSNPSLSRCASRDNLHVPNMHRLPRMASHEAMSRFGHAHSKSAGLRQAFKTLCPGRPQSPGHKYKHIVDWKPLRDGHVSISAPQTPEPEDDGASYFEPRKPSPSPQPREFLLRTSSDTSIPTTSFSEHRRERSRSRSRGPSSLRGSMTLDDTARLEMERALHQRNALETLIEAASPQQTPIRALRSINHEQDDEEATPVGVSKRLPTLPNTPSSAYPPSTAGLSPERKFAQQIDTSCSRFSASTIDTECQTYSISINDTSRFSEWSTASDLISPTSDSTVEDIIASPVLDGTDFAPAIRPVTTRSPELEGVFSPDEHDSSNAVPVTSYKVIPSSPPAMLSNQQAKLQSVHANGEFQHYQLPEEDITSNGTKYQAIPQGYSSMSAIAEPIHSHLRAQSQQLIDRRSGFPHSENMQQLLDELSYLSNVITQQ